MTNRDVLAYALKVQRLHEVLVLKDDIHLQYKYKNINRATTQAATFQDKIIDTIIENNVTGTGDLIKKSHIKKNVNKIIDTNLRNDAKRISYGIPDKVVKAAVSNISNRYQFILDNRINEEISTLESKINKYKEKNKDTFKKLSEKEKIETLKNLNAEHAQSKIKNILHDSFHTNECNLSWIKAVNDGYNYKIWNNGRTKKTRAWHRAKFIASVPIDETFDIYGSYPARMMYPGDLNGGAENVANCKCWLSYSNRKPSDLRGTGKKTTTKSSKSKNNNIISKIKNTVKKPINNIKSKISRKSKPETKTTINNKSKRIMNTIKSKIKEKEVKKIMKNYHDYSGIENLFEYLRQIYPEPFLSKEEIENVAQWARDSNFFNEYFLNGEISIDGFEKVKVLNNIINKYPNIKNKVQLHRFQRNDFFIVDVGKKGIFRKFISTSFSESKSKEYGDYHIIFLTPKGTNGAFIEETLRKYDGREDKHSMEDVLAYNTYYETLYMNYRTKLAVIRIIVE